MICKKRKWFIQLRGKNKLKVIMRKKSKVKANKLILMHDVFVQLSKNSNAQINRLKILKF